MRSSGPSNGIAEDTGFGFGEALGSGFLIGGGVWIVFYFALVNAIWRREGKKYFVALFVVGFMTSIFSGLILFPDHNAVSPPKSATSANFDTQ